MVAPDARASGKSLAVAPVRRVFRARALFDLRYGAEVEIDAGDIASYYLVRATLAGSGMVELGRRSAAIRAGSLTVSSPSERSLIGASQRLRAASLILRVGGRRWNAAQQLDVRSGAAGATYVGGGAGNRRPATTNVTADDILLRPA